MKKVFYFLTILISVFSLSSCLKENFNAAEGVLNPMASVYVVRAAYKDADVKLGPQTLAGAHLTAGIVVSDASSHNLPDGYVVIQNRWRGLVRGLVLALDQTTASSLVVGDSVVVELNGTTLSRSAGPLIVTGLNGSNVNKISSNQTVITRPVSISELTKNFYNYENTLISITADVTPFPVNETFSGNKTISDGANSSYNLYTESNSAFADLNIAPSATFIGIPYMANSETQQLRLRTIGDMLNPSGPIYPGYPEDFESPDFSLKGTYAGKSIDLKTGSWRLEQCLLGNTAGRDRIVSGTQSIRFQQGLTDATPCYLQMNYDLTNGATKVTFWYGCYYTDASSSFILEYSTDQGVTWHQTGDIISDPLPTSTSTAPKQATFLMDIKGPVRFRIFKLGLGPTSIPTIYNGRLGIDDFAIYQGY